MARTPLVEGLPNNTRSPGFPVQHGLVAQACHHRWRQGDQESKVILRLQKEFLGYKRPCLKTKEEKKKCCIRLDKPGVVCLPHREGCRARIAVTSRPEQHPTLPPSLLTPLLMCETIHSYVRVYFLYPWLALNL